MVILLLPLLILIVISLIYLLMGGVALWRRGWQEHPIRLLAIFTFTAAAAELLHAMWQLLYIALRPSDPDFLQFPIQSILLLAFIYFLLSRAFLRLNETDRNWWTLGIAVMVVTMSLRLFVFFLLPPMLMVGNLPIPRHQIGLSVIVIGWAIFMSGVAMLTFRASAQAQGPLHRNRIRYWLLGLWLFLLSDTMLFSGHDLLGSTARLGATLIIVYAISRHQLLNITRLLRHVLNYIIITLLMTFLYLTSFMAVRYAMQNEFGYNNLVPPLAIVSLLVALAYNPLLTLVKNFVDPFMLGHRYNANDLVREYSSSISNILSLHRLAIVALETFHQTFDLQHGTLFLIQSDPDHSLIHLQAVQSLGSKQLPSTHLQSNNPLVTHLQENHQPLTQYDLDMLPQFKPMLRSERAWLSGLGVEVYVPIHAKQEWVGLFVLGPKSSRKAYFDNDLTLLGTLADQTAVALQNARLVENLVKLNRDLKAAYADIDKANQQLKELDNLKSAFIGVITHELRTPFINIDFSIQLMERQGVEHMLMEQQEQFEQLKTHAKFAKQMVDNLVNFAAFLSKRAELYSRPVQMAQVIHDAIGPNRALASKKQLGLYVDHPAKLPVIYGDEQRLRDAVYQLINNAIKFTPHGGKIWVRCFATDQGLKLEVQDTGMGIPADKLPALWEGFSQMSDTLRRGLEGLGLGLTLVKYVVNGHGGEVFATSEVNVGSTFGFQIPIGSAP